jgi:hypothetical protein
MVTKLERIAEISANTRKPEFTSLYHHRTKSLKATAWFGD